MSGSREETLELVLVCLLAVPNRNYITSSLHQKHTLCVSQLVGHYCMPLLYCTVLYCAVYELTDNVVTVILAYTS